jgi:hypothetical protein
MTIEPSATAGRRNRSQIIAISAGALTVIAIVLAFASTYLGVGWLWLRPAAELLLLAELVGLVVLERHQLFEPVHGKVYEIKADTAEILQSLGLLTNLVSDAGQI